MERLSQWAQEEAATDQLATIVSSTAVSARQGSRLLQARVADNDYPSGTSGERAELATWGGRLTFRVGDERRIGWSTWFPADFIPETGWYT